MSEHRGLGRAWRAVALSLASLAAFGCIQGDRGAPGPSGVGTEGPQGEQGDPTPGLPSISSVLPGTVYRQHDVDVLISGFGTSFDESTELDFGEGVEVVSLTVVSPTALRARLVIAPDAPLTTRDVVVGDATYAGAFSVEDPLSAHVVGEWPAPVQGSLIQLEALQRDVARPFSSPRAFLRDGDDALSDGLVTGSSAYAVSFFQFIDVDAPTGALDTVVSDGPVPLDVLSVAPASVTVAPRAAVPLVAGVNAGTLTEARETALHSLPASNADRWVRFAVDAPGRRTMFILPDTSFEDRALLTAAGGAFQGSRWVELTTLVPAAATPHVVTWEDSDDPSGDFELEVTETPATDLIPAEIASPGEQDWYHFEAFAGDVVNVAIVNGVTTGCGQFAATVEIWGSTQGRLLSDSATCPGYFDAVQDPTGCANILGCLAVTTCEGQPCCALFACEEPLVELELPADGGYFVRVYPSGNLPAFDYAAFIQVSTP